MAIKHSKYRNPAILFELLVRQTTADLIQNKESKAVKILKKYFTGTELGKEYTLYSSFNTVGKLSESRAEMFINTVLDQRSKLDLEKIGRLKYNLIKEIKLNYNMDDFFKAKVENYKVYAAIYTIFESQGTKTIDTKQILENKINILDHIVDTKVVTKTPSEELVEEFMKEDKEIRLMAYKILVEKFNQKYSGLSDRQKEILKEYISNVSDTDNLRKYLNRIVKEIKTELVAINESLEDPITKIRLTETIKLLQPIKQNQSIKDEMISSLLQYVELSETLKKI
jgi:hypothetical protein